MDIMDLASKGIVKITKNYGKKIQKTETAYPIPETKPVVIAGEGYRAGFARAEIMPDLSLDRTYWIAPSVEKRLYAPSDLTPQSAPY